MSHPAAAELLRELRDAGALVVAKGDRLRINAPIGVLRPEIEEQLRERKLDIIALLSHETHLCSRCHRFAFHEPRTCYWCRRAAATAVEA